MKIVSAYRLLGGRSTFNVAYEPLICFLAASVDGMIYYLSECYRDNVLKESKQAGSKKASNEIT